MSKYKSKIAQDYKELYDTNDDQRVAEELKALEKKKFLFSEISRNEGLLEKGIKEYNDYLAKYRERTKYYQALMQQLEDLSHVFATEDEKLQVVNA